MIQKITRQNLEKFLEKYASSAKTLNIGSGGTNYRHFFPNQVTLDISSDNNPDVVGDAHSLPFKKNEFELILCTEVLEHLLDPKKAISEFKRVLKTGGTLILTTRFIYPIHHVPNDYWRFTEFGLRELFKNWKIVHLQPETQTFSALGALLQRVCYQTKLIWNKPVKILLFISAWILNKANFFILAEYGDIKREHVKDAIISTGYYLVAAKEI